LSAAAISLPIVSLKTKELLKPSLSDALQLPARMLQLLAPSRPAADDGLSPLVASQAADVGSIPIARFRKPVDAVGLTDFPSLNRPVNRYVLDAIGRSSVKSPCFGRGEMQML